MNVIAWLEFELANFDSAVQRFNHYTPPHFWSLWVFVCVYMYERVYVFSTCVKLHRFISLYLFSLLKYACWRIRAFSCISVFAWFYAWRSAEKFIGWPRYSHEMRSWRLFFNVILPGSTHNFTRYCSAWISLVKNQQQIWRNHLNFSAYEIFNLPSNFGVSSWCNG